MPAILQSAEYRRQQREALDQADQLRYPSLMCADDDAWVALYDAYKLPLLRFFQSKGIAIAADGEDLLQSTFAEVFVNLERYDPQEGPLRNWIYGVAKNKWLQHLDKAKTIPFSELPEEELLAAARDTANDHYGDDAKKAHLEAAIARLPAKYAQIVRLRAERPEGQATWPILAEELDIKESAAKMRYSRALLLLEKDLTANPPP